MSARPEDLDLQSEILLSRYPPELFAYTRLGIPPARFATRTAGAEWQVAVREVEGSFLVANLSRIGICLAGTASLKIDSRYTLVLHGPAGRSAVDFYVLRCHFQPEAVAGRPGYRMAGLFTELLDREDLPD